MEWLLREIHGSCMYTWEEHRTACTNMAAKLRSLVTKCETGTFLIRLSKSPSERQEKLVNYIDIPPGMF